MKQTAEGTEELEGVHFLTPEEGWEVLDRQARRYLRMSGEEFIEAWRAGKFDDNPDRPEVMRVAMLLPLVAQ